MKRGDLPRPTLTTLQGKTIYALIQNFLFRPRRKIFFSDPDGKIFFFGVPCWIGKENFGYPREKILGYPEEKFSSPWLCVILALQRVEDCLDARVHFLIG
ncbi:hypothetical protein HRbin15_02673 [bacterium HR15]|nr:hypothetical protein HRbin15_02673 [bacterium HR15]